MTTQQNSFRAVDGFRRRPYSQCMKKVGSGLTPVVAIDRKTPKPLHRQIYDAYRTAILEGELAPGERVPSSRELAVELGISRIPVLNAYSQLLSEGLLEGRRSVGTFVSASWLGWEPSAKPKKDSLRPSSTARDVSRRANSLPIFVPGPWSYRQGAFAIGQVALDLFPFHVWSRLIVRHSRNRHAKSPNPMGSLDFRKVLATYLRTVRAVKCEPEQI